MRRDYKIITKSNYKVITAGIAALVFWAILLGGCSATTDREENPTPNENVPVKEYFNRSDELFKQRDDLKNVREGIELLKRVRQADRRNYETAWKLSRLYYYLGKYSKDEKESDQALKDGIETARLATRIEAEKPDGYFWLGANLGERAKHNPLTGLASLDDIKGAMQKVISLQPDYEGASAYDVLAQIELETDIFGGSAQKAVELLETAVSLEKNNSYLYLHLGEAYLAVDRNAEGKKQLETVLKMKPDPDHLFEHQEAVEEAKKVLQNRF
jgi:tetratricopeptide (TPR) repeat protein